MSNYPEKYTFFIIETFIAMETPYDLYKTNSWSKFSVAQYIVFLANKSNIKCIDSATKFEI